LATLLVGASLLAACGGTAATASPTSGGGTPTIAPTSVATPVVTPSSATSLPPTPTFGGTNEPPLGSVCAAFPTIDPKNPLNFPSPVPDPTLEAHFPAQVDGNNVTDLQSGNWAAFVCLGGDSAAIDQLQSQIGVSLADASWASAKAVADDEQVDLFGLRVPGGSAQQLVGVIAQIVALSGHNMTTEGTVGQGTAGGKQVFTYTDANGTSYGLVIGDSLIFAGPMTQSQADEVFSAVR
jgi:hypothetical protein